MLATLLKNLFSRATPPHPPDAAGAAEPDRAGLARFAAGEFAAAEQDFRAALALAPADPFYACHLASALCAQGQLAAAGPYALAAWRGAMDNANHAECLKYVVMNIEADGGTDFLALIGTGNRLRLAGDFAGAEAAYHRARLAPDAAIAFADNRIGALLCCMGRYAESAPFFAAGARAHMMLDRVTDFSADFLDGLAAQGGAFAADLPAMALPPPQGGCPGPVLLMSCDSGYFDRFAFALAHSVSRNAAARCALHFHIVNPDERVEAGLARMRAHFPDLPIALGSEQCDVTRFFQPKAYYACARLLRLAQIMHHYRRPVMVIDIDLLVARGLGPLLQGLQDDDMAAPLMNTGRGEPGELLSAACVYFAFTDAGLKAAALAGAYIAHYARDGRLLWFIDQIALLACVAQIREGRLAAKLALLPDSTFSSDGADTQNTHCYFSNINFSVEAGAALAENIEFLKYAGDPAR
jgi:tetratricopeptide (TPR) repeat protein